MKLELQSITPCPSGFGEYQLTLGSNRIVVNTQQKFLHRPDIEGKVHHGGCSTVIAFMGEDQEDNIGGLYLWYNDTPHRLNQAHKSGQMITDHKTN